MANAQLTQCPPNLRQMPLVHLAAGLRRDEVVRAAVGIERAKQPMRRDRLTQPEKARHRAFLVHQDRRVDPIRRIIQRHDQIQIVSQRADPAMRRTS